MSIPVSLKELNISEKAFETIVSHLEAVFPEEGCGFFFGKDGAVRMVQEANIVDNVKEGDRKRRFLISPDDYRKAELYAIKNDLDLLGVYHSHPNHPAIPSEHDLSVALPYFSYIIVSVMDGKWAKVASFRLNETSRQFEEETIIQPN